MRKLHYILPFALIIMMITPALALSPNDVIDNITTAIKAGNAAQLATYFDSNVELTVSDKQATYSKAQAQVVIKDFFEKNPVKNFVIVHRGSNEAGSSYAIGTLTSTSQSFRTYIYVKVKGTTTLIEELRFEKS